MGAFRMPGTATGCELLDSMDQMDARTDTALRLCDPKSSSQQKFANGKCESIASASRCPTARFLHELRHIAEHRRLPFVFPIQVRRPHVAHIHIHFFISLSSMAHLRPIRHVLSSSRFITTPQCQRIRRGFASATTTDAANLPLAGIKVLDMTRVLAGVGHCCPFRFEDSD